MQGRCCGEGGRCRTACPGHGLHEVGKQAVAQQARTGPGVSGWGRGSWAAGPRPGAPGVAGAGARVSVLRRGPASTYPRRHSDRQRQKQQRCEEEDGEGPAPQQGLQAGRGHLLWAQTVRARAAAAPAALSTEGHDWGDATRPRPDGGRPLPP